MIDPYRVAVLIQSKDTGRFEDKTWKIAEYRFRAADQRVDITFNAGGTYTYRPDRVEVLECPARIALLPGSRIAVDGVVWGNVTEVLAFAGASGGWWRIFYPRRGQKTYRTFHSSQVCVMENAAAEPAVADVLDYWQAILARIPDDDPIQRPYSGLGFVHRESVLGRYLAGAPIECREPIEHPIFPFRCNLSQRKAMEKALSRSVSVIEGPPGTGKTETILNLIANILANDAGSVGVVSFSNAAVDNVRDKLEALGLGHVIANLGKRAKKEQFFAAQLARAEQVRTFLAAAPDEPPPTGRMLALDSRLRQAQEAERRRAESRHEVAAFRLEREHFLRHLRRHDVPELANFPLLSRPSDRILDFLVETAVADPSVRPGLLTRIRNYFRYGSQRGLDPADTEVILRLQQAFYDRRIDELEQQIREADAILRQADFDRLATQHQEMSAETLRAALADRHRSLPSTPYTIETYRQGSTFARFMRDYPVLLSTCHSLRATLAEGYLLDYLIIDEASQVDLLAAGLGLSCCRNLVVVGDLQQLPPIENTAAAGLDPPRPAYDYGRHSILSSMIELYSAGLPRTLLREHYRCDPAIIGFCNKTFYRGELIPFTTSGSERPMTAVRTVEGNHMREHRGGGRTNQREVDVIVNEVLVELVTAGTGADIGIITPYRLQVDKIAGALIEQYVTDTVHKFQGRQKDVIILSTVLDETWRGQRGLRFVDDPRLINVAVSRAIKTFVIVTNHAMLPRSRNIRDLIGYIRYCHPDDEGLVDSAVISIFDLLYREYSARLRPLAEKVQGTMRYRSEEIAWTLLQGILAEDTYAHLTASCQVLLRNLLTDLSLLSPAQKTYVQNRASVDFVVSNRVTNRPLLAIEVDGFAFHENNPSQRQRDMLKNEILAAHQMPLLRLPTTGSGEEQRIRRELAAAEAHWAGLSRL